MPVVSTFFMDVHKLRAPRHHRPIDNSLSADNMNRRKGVTTRREASLIRERLACSPPVRPYASCSGLFIANRLLGADAISGYLSAQRSRKERIKKSLRRRRNRGRREHRGCFRSTIKQSVLWLQRCTTRRLQALAWLKVVLASGQLRAAPQCAKRSPVAACATLLAVLGWRRHP